MAATLDSAYAEAAHRVGAKGDPDWLVRERRTALERFLAVGFPTTRDEEYRFTSVAPIAGGGFAPAQGLTDSLDKRTLGPYAISGPIAATLVFVNGRFVPSASAVGRLPNGVRVESLAAALIDSRGGVEGYCGRAACVEDRAFTALNAAFLSDGAYIRVPDETVVEAPIHLVFLTAPGGRATMAAPRVLAVLGRSSQATIVESYGAVGEGGSFTNAVTEAFVGENASLSHYKLERDVPGSFHVGGMFLQASRNSQITANSLMLGGASLVRNDVTAVLGGEGGICTLNGLYVASGDRLVDNHTTIDHAVPHCDSREVYKGILSGRARGVFNGKIIVRPDAQKTDAKQTNKALLLSNEAQINTKPQLEIFANDVKCTHGAAIGQMDEDALFYLRARGIRLRDARHMLIRAFAGDVLHQMPLEALRQQIDEELGARLPEEGQ
jgi:Fe-S cluster assembly protein SufD